MFEDTQGTPLHTGNMAIQHTSSLYTTYILPCFKARFLIVLKPHRTYLLITTLRGKKIGRLKSKIPFCLYFLFFSLVSMYCKMLPAMCKTLGYTWTFVRASLQIGMQWQEPGGKWCRRDFQDSQSLAGHHKDTGFYSGNGKQ